MIFTRNLTADEYHEKEAEELKEKEARPQGLEEGVRERTLRAALNLKLSGLLNTGQITGPWKYVMKIRGDQVLDGLKDEEIFCGSNEPDSGYLLNRL